MLPYREYLDERLNQNRFRISVNCRQTPGVMVAEHWHPYLEMLYVFGGSAWQTVDGEGFRLDAGDTLLIASGATHSTTALEENSYIGVMIFFQSQPFPTTYLPAGRCADTARLFSRMQEEATLQEPGYRLAAQGLLWETLGLLQRFGTPMPKDAASCGEGQRLEEYVRSHLSQPLTLASAAAFAGYSPSYFSRYFQKVMGLPFKVYVDRMKMQTARGMLADNIPPGEIAAALGYETPSSFYRAFKRLTGQTPSSCRTDAGQEMDRT